MTHYKRRWKNKRKELSTDSSFLELWCFVRAKLAAAAESATKSVTTTAAKNQKNPDDATAVAHSAGEAIASASTAAAE